MLNQLNIPNNILWKIQAKGKIVIFNEPYVSYEVTVKYRGYGAVEAAKHGAVATLIRSYYPSLNAVQVKQIIMESGTPLKNTVTIGEDKHKANFTDASKSGRIVNAYNALVLAAKMAK